MERRRFLQTVGAVGAVAGVGSTAILSNTATAQSDTPPTVGSVPAGSTVALEEVASGLNQPVRLTAADEEADRRFLADRSGQIYAHGSDGLDSEPFLDIGENVLQSREQGLLGLAMHPEFSSNGRFYVRYSAAKTEDTPSEYAHTFVLAEFTTSDDLSQVDASSERRVLEIPQPYANHNAGPIAFGPDGYLYITVGDGGDFMDTGRGHASDWYDANDGGNGQNLTENLLGSVLRIDVDNTENGTEYAIPDDNPLVGKDGLDEQYAWGFRNPFGISFDGEELFVSDSGQDLAEEVNLVEKGKNYGWNVMEGSLCFKEKDGYVSEDPRESCPDESPRGNTLQTPEIEYRHREGADFNTVVLGGYRYRNSTVPSIQDAYIFGNYNTDGGGPDGGALYAARPPESGSGQWDLKKLGIEGNEENELGFTILGFGRDSAGELYVCGRGSNGGVVYRISRADSSEPPSTSTTSSTPTTGSSTSSSPAATSSPTESTQRSRSGTPGETDSDPGTASDGLPGFGVGTALVSVLASAGVLQRRLRRREE